ncbi:MAG: cell division protein FtsQ/DivIB [Burkholderiaceae bacterium]
MFWNDTRLLGLLANALFATASFGFVAAALVWVAERPYFDFRVVEIGAVPGSALRHVPAQTLAQRIREARVGSFFSIDMTELAERIETVPWVRRATVRRVWPDRLVVLIEEHRPHAIWEDGRLINHYGELFDANLDEAVADGPLPQLSGPSPDTVLQVVKRYDELVRLTKELGMVPVSVSLSDRRAWRATMEDGTELVIGREHGVPVSDRIRRWASVFPLVTERIQRRASVIDLRYESGFSVRSLEPLAEAFDIDDLIDESLRRDQSRQPNAGAPARGEDPSGAELARVFSPAGRTSDPQGVLARPVPAVQGIKP